MALAEPSILAFGASHLSCLTMSQSSSGLVLEHVIHQPIENDSNQSEDWVASVETGLARLAQKTSLKSVTSVVLPSWAVFTKLLKVARIEGEGQREVVRFEAENAMPNGLQGHDWSYHVLKDDGFERDVLLQAVSSDLLEGLLEVLASHGAHPTVIGGHIASQLAAFENQYGEEAGTSVLLDVGSRSVSLLVGSTGDSPFIRSFNFGGSLVTQSLAQKTGKSFREAEALKLEWIQNTSESADQELLNQASEGFVNRLVNEVQRSMALYRRQGQSGSPDRILLSGGASQLPGLAEFLERKTGIPCSFYDPFRSISSGLAVAVSETSEVSYALAAPMGMAWNSISEGFKYGNLLSPQASSGAALSGRQPWLLMAAALFLLAGLVVGLKFHVRAWQLQSEVVRMEAELSPLESLSQQVTQAYNEYTSRVKSAELKSAMIQEQRYWVAFLADLQGRLNQVQDVWLESIAPESSETDGVSNRLRVTGSLLDRENPLSVVSSNSQGRVEVLLGSFEDSPFIETVADRRFDTSRPGILQFDFSLVVNPEVVF